MNLTSFQQRSGSHHVSAHGVARAAGPVHRLLHARLVGEDGHVPFEVLDLAEARGLPQAGVEHGQVAVQERGHGPAVQGLVVRAAGHDAVFLQELPTEEDAVDGGLVRERELGGVVVSRPCACPHQRRSRRRPGSSHRRSPAAWGCRPCRGWSASWPSPAGRPRSNRPWGRPPWLCRRGSCCSTHRRWGRRRAARPAICRPC